MAAEVQKLKRTTFQVQSVIYSMNVTIAKWFASLTFKYVCKLNTVTSFSAL